LKSQLRIFINGKFLSQKATGVQKYALGISMALQKINPDIIVLAPTGNYDTSKLVIKQFKFGRGLMFEQVWLPLFVLFHKNSLLINLCNTAPLLLKKQIVTIHDLAFLKNEAWFSSSFRRWYSFLIPKLCKRSLAILTVSEFIKNEIIAEYSVSPEKITVAPNGIPEIVFDEEKPFSFRYLMLTGIFNRRKNSSFVLSLLPAIKKMNLHIVGIGSDADIFGENKLPEDDYLHILNYIDDRKYYTLLKHATILIFPSDYEGFGIPVLEALEMETPVMVPDMPVYRESFGGLPIYYSANNAEDFLKKLNNINKGESPKKDEAFLKNKFNFDKSAMKVSEIIKHYQ
jgi:glycosyltransferase involved in cell wall biosynthesis